MNSAKNKIENGKPEAPARLEGLARNPRLIIAALVLCFILALALRIHFSRFGVTDPEQLIWLIQARDMFSDDNGPALLDDVKLAPLYPALISIPVKLGADPETAGVWVSLIAGALTVVPVFLAALMLGGLGSAVLASIIFAFLPLALASSGSLSLGSTYTFLITAVLAAMIFDLKKPSLVRMILVSAFCGLAALCAFSCGAALFAAAVLNHLLSGGFHGRTLKSLARELGSGLIVFALFSFVQFYWRTMTAATTGDPGLPFLMSAAPLTFFMLAFLGALPRFKAAFGQLIIWVALLLWLLAISGERLFGAGRELETESMLTPLFTGLCVFAGRSVLVIYYRREINSASAPMRVFLALLIAILAVHFFSMSVINARYYRKVMTHRAELLSGRKALAKEAGEFMEVKPGARVCSLDFLFAYQFEGQPTLLAKTLEGLARQLENGPCDYVAVDSMSVWRKAPVLRPLLTGRAAPPGMELGFLRRPPDRDLLVAVYEAGGKSFSLPALNPGASPEQIQKIAILADQYYREGYLDQARLLYESIVANSSNREARRMLINVYIALGYFDGEEFDRAEQVLREYALLAPDDSQLDDYRRTIHLLRLKHQARWAGR